MFIYHCIVRAWHLTVCVSIEDEWMDETNVLGL